MWVSEGGIITVGMDKVVKLWHFSNERYIICLTQEMYSLSGKIHLIP